MIMIQGTGLGFWSFLVMKRCIGLKYIRSFIQRSKGLPHRFAGLLRIHRRGIQSLAWISRCRVSKASLRSVARIDREYSFWHPEPIDPGRHRRWHRRRRPPPQRRRSPPRKNRGHHRPTGRHNRHCRRSRQDPSPPRRWPQADPGYRSCRGRHHESRPGYGVGRN